MSSTSSWTAGIAPDLTAVAQPGLIADLVHRRARPGRPSAGPAAPAVAANVTRYWNPAWRQYASVDGVLYGSPLGANLKSLVWYSPKRFTDQGYRPPTTWGELMDLSERIARSGGAEPWCGGIEDGAATGWPATDWLEEVVLGSGGSAVYDAWVSHDLPVRLADNPHGDVGARRLDAQPGVRQRRIRERGEHRPHVLRGRRRVDSRRHLHDVPVPLLLRRVVDA